MPTNGRRDSSPSSRPNPSRSLSGQISQLGARINRALSGDRLGRDSDSMTSASTVVTEDANARSVSRGRTGFSSYGRGGLGNIHENGAGYDESNVVRGRDRARVGSVDPLPPPERAFSTGRGGVGNIRAPSVDSVTSDAASSKSVPTTFTSVTTVVTPGTTSRSLSRGPPMVSTGRGGLGNIRNSQTTTGPPRR
ncbi:hypothetical protein PM082_007588 [Marasmius tenuissimus]|nr:hypothetical protein PM082_007588 [Marasmius tenuissimus]